MPENKNRKKRGGKMMKRARRQVRIANQPYFDELKNQGLQAQQTYENSNERVTDIYNRLQKELGGLFPEYDQRAQNIIGDTTAQVGEWADLLNQGQSGAEAQAATQAFGTQGLAGTRLMEADRMRNVNFFQGTQSQAAVERMELQRDNLNLLNQMKEEIALARRQGKALLPAQILERFDQLRQSRREFRLAKKEQEIRQQLADRELDLVEKKNRQTNRLKNRQQNWVEDKLTEEEQRTRLNKQIKSAGQRLADILALIDAEKAQPDYGGGGWENAGSGDLALLQQRRRRTSRRIRKLKKKRRKL